MSVKPIVWVGSTLERLRAFPDAARRDVGHQLHLVQSGLEPADWKPMSSVGPGVFEIRVHAGGEFRAFYVTKQTDAVYVLHAFEKKTQKTRRADVDIGKRNLRLVLAREARS